MFLSFPMGPVLAALWGALWGSFLNVVIERLPRGGSVLRPASHCLACQTPIRIYDNIPLLSYLFLRGRCRTCSARFSPRYVLVEALGLLVALLCFHHAVTLGTGSSSLRLASFLLAFFFCLGLLAILFIDLRTMIIPDAISLPMLLVLGPAAVAIGRLTWQDATLGAALGFGLVYAVRALWFLVKGEEGIGLGDAKLLAVIGGVLGWQALPPVLLLASVQGLIVALPLRLAGRSMLARESYQGTSVRAAGEAEDPGDGTTGALEHLANDPDSSPEMDVQALPQTGAERTSENELYDEVPAGAVPFGPFLALAAMEWLLGGAFLSERFSGALDALLGFQ